MYLSIWVTHHSANFLTNFGSIEELATILTKIYSHKVTLEHTIAHFLSIHARSYSTRSRTKTDGSSTVLSVRVLDEKSKQEMRELHAEDAERWTPTALALRYSAYTENVKAVLSMASLRSRIPDACAAAAAKLDDTWRELSAASKVPGRTIKHTVPVQPLPDSQAGTKDETGSAQGAVTSTEQSDVSDEAADTVGTSVTADWAREQIARAEFETVRKSTFAFIEVGKGLEDAQRAVWLRDGRTGQLRAPSARERARLLDQRRIN